MAIEGSGGGVSRHPQSNTPVHKKTWLQIRLHNLLLDAEHAVRFRIDVYLQPVNFGFAVRVHPRKEQIRKRLIHEEEMVIAVRKDHRSAVRRGQCLEAREKGLEPARAIDRIGRETVRARLHHQEHALRVASRAKDLVEPRQSGRLTTLELGDAIGPRRGAAVCR